MTRAWAPRTLDEALRVLADPELAAVAVAGCTDVLVVDTATGRRHTAVVDLTRLPELRGIRATADHVDIGAGVTFSELRRDAAVAEHWPILSEIAATIGGWQIQNRATLGGNIANASPVGDSLPCLLALDAQLELQSSHGARRLPYAEMHTGYRRTALAPGELIVRVRIPRPTPWTRQFVKKVGTREAQAISKVVAAFVARVDPATRTLTSVRCAAGAVAATPVRLAAVEHVCEGAAATAELAELAAAAACGAVEPIDDVRSTAEYRRWVLGRLVRRMVRNAGHAPEANPGAAGVLPMPPKLPGT